MLATVTLYNVVAFVHVAAVIAAFGVTFAYPIITPFVTRTDPRALPVLHRAQALVGKRLISLGLLVALLSGAYLATDADVWSEMWVSISMLIIIVLGGLGGAFFGPQETKAAELAERDIAASTGDTVELSAEYAAVAGRIAAVGAIASVLVLVAAFLMVVKP
jgi:Sec-independent protein secretion pathway component TatC